MSKPLYRYQFSEAAPIEEVEITLLMAAFGVESLHGEVQARLDAAHAFDPEKRTCVIDASTPVGRDLNKLFAGFLRREFGDACFTVERLDGAMPPRAAAAVAS
jgi:hypothetical protein